MTFYYKYDWAINYYLYNSQILQYLIWTNAVSVEVQHDDGEKRLLVRTV